jgi:amino acid transporter
VISFPTSLAFLASILAYAIGHANLACNNYYVIFIILSIPWGGTWITLRGIELASFITNIGSISRTKIPGMMIIVLRIAWLTTGDRPHRELSFSALLPPLDSQEKFAFLFNILLRLARFEISAAHAQDVRNPQRDSPRAILLSLLGSLAIAVSVPEEIFTLESGVIQAIEALCAKFDMSWIAK